MNMKRRLIAIATVFSSLITFGSNASANDIKVMPSTACQPPDQKEAVKIRFFEGAILNDSSTDAFIVCPFVKDNNNRGIGQIFSAVVQVNGANGKNVFCSLTSRKPGGNFIADDFSAGGANGPSFLALNIKESNIFNSYYSISCILPPRGRVFSYRTFEPSPTDDNN